MNNDNSSKKDTPNTSKIDLNALLNRDNNDDVNTIRSPHSVTTTTVTTTTTTSAPSYQLPPQPQAAQLPPLQQEYKPIYQPQAHQQQQQPVSTYPSSYYASAAPQYQAPKSVVAPTDPAPAHYAPQQQHPHQQHYSTHPSQQQQQQRQQQQQQHQAQQPNQAHETQQYYPPVEVVLAPPLVNKRNIHKRKRSTNSSWLPQDDLNLIDLVTDTLPRQDFNKYAQILGKRNGQSVRYRWNSILKRFKLELAEGNLNGRFGKKTDQAEDSGEDSEDDEDIEDNASTNEGGS